MRRCFVVVLFAVLAGCATAKRGPTETFEVRSSPPGASVASTSGWECTTPCSVKVARRGDFVVTVRKDGYVTQTFTIKSVPIQSQKKGSRTASCWRTPNTSVARPIGPPVPTASTSRIP